MKMNRVMLPVVAAGVLVGAINAGAVPTYSAVSYDETLFQSGQTLNAAGLQGNVSMGIDGNSLYIKLQNTSLAGSVVAGSAAGGISGIAFNLPSGITITGGSITPVGTQNPSPWDMTAAQIQWGWRQGSPITASGGLAAALNTYSAETATMASDTTSSFGGGNVDGLNYYAYSAATTPVPGVGSPSVVDTVIIQLNLASTTGLTVSGLDAGKIALIFGSADSVPDGGTTAMLLGIALSGLGFVARRVRK
jgi:hypothetical protein